MKQKVDERLIIINNYINRNCKKTISYDNALKQFKIIEIALVIPPKLTRIF